MRPARFQLATSASVLRASSTEVLDLTPLGIFVIALAEQKPEELERAAKKLTSAFDPAA